MIIYCIDEEDVNCLDSMIEDEIGQCVELVGIVNEIVEGTEDIDIYWEDSIKIEANEFVAISSIIEFWGSDDSIKRDDWLRSLLFW